MPHGGPDWGTPGPLATVYTLEDMAELVVRLGSIDTFDRRGNVIFLDDFESSINKWKTEAFGDGASVAITADTARNGAFSAKLVTGDDTGDYSRIYRDMAYPKLSRIGVEFSACFDPQLSFLGLRFTLFDGTGYWDAHIRYYHNDKQIIYYDGLGFYVPLITDFQISLSAKQFHTFKLVIDPENNRYHRLIIDSYAYDISDKALYKPDSDTSPLLQLFITAMPIKGFNAVTYIDDVILTQNEP